MWLVALAWTDHLILMYFDDGYDVDVIRMTKQA